MCVVSKVMLFQATESLKIGKCCRSTHFRWSLSLVTRWSLAGHLRWSLAGYSLVTPSALLLICGGHISNLVIRWADDKFHDHAHNFCRNMYKKMGVMALVIGVRVNSEGKIVIAG